MSSAALLLSILAPAYLLRAQPVTQFASPVAVGEQSAPLQVTVAIIATGTSTDPQAVTEGIAGQDFSLAGGGTCSDAPVTAGQQCIANVVFSPKYPGLRQGAVIVKAADGTLLGTALVSGIGTGPLAVLDPGAINTVVGDSEWFYAGDNVAAINAPIHEPAAVLVDPAGNIYLSDSENYRVRRVDGQTQTITTVAGTGNPGYSGDGGQATSAAISTPAGLAIDGAGNIYFADTGNQIVRRIGVDGVITTVAGAPQTQGYSGDGGPATAAKLSLPQGVALDASGNLYIADTGNGVIREVDATSGNISTIAGVAGTANFNGDGAATASHLNQPWSVAVAADNSLYIADSGNNRIRRLSGGTLSTVAGSGAQGYNGDTGPAAAATLNLPLGVALDPAGDLYIADSGNDCVRKISSSTGDVTAGSATIQTIIGTGSEGYSGDSGPANKAALHGPYVVFFAQNGDAYVADTINNRIRAILATPVTLPQFPDTKVTKTSSPAVIQGLDSDGNAELDLSTPTLVNATLDTTSTTCSFTTATVQGSSCNLGVEFAPTTVQQNLQGSVTLNSTTATGLATIDIFGNGLDVNPTTMSLGANPNPGVLNQPIIFTTTVSSDDPSTPVTGPVTFVEGSTTLCSVSLNNGRASCSYTPLVLGEHTITANYAGDANNEANTASVTVNVRQQATLQLTVNPAPDATVLQNVTLTMTVTPPTGSATGTVIFYDGSNVLTGPLPLNGSAVATYSTSSLSPGQHNLSAQYSGDTANASGTSNVVSELIAQSDTTTSLSTTNATPTVGESFALTANVTSADGATPTGTVSFTDNGSPLGSAALDGSGAATITVSSLSPGTHSIVAHYGGDTNNAASDASPLTETVAQIGTVTALAPDANPLSAGATLHLTASVSLAAGATADGPLGGTITFSDGGVTIGTANLDSSGNATLAISTLSVGSHTLLASYGGATNYAPSNSSQLMQQVQKTSTTVSTTTSAASVLAAESVTFTATVTSSTGIPTGTATLYDGGTPLQTQTLNGQGMASFSLNTLATGSHSISIGYSGDANYSASTSAIFAEAVNFAQPQITLSGPIAPVNVGVAVTLTGNITSPGMHPTGALTLRDGATSIASQAVSTSGSFTFSTSSLSLGTHQLSVTFAGDDDNSTAISPAVAVTIQLAPTAVALGAGSNPGTYGQPVTFTASVVSASPGATGSVNFFDGATQIGTVSLSSGGTATLTTSSLGFGVHSVSAVYTGDAQHATSTSAGVSERIVEPATATLSSSANPSVAGPDVVFTATIVAQGSQIPTGAVTFRDNGTTLGNITLDGNGSATLHTSSLSVGTHNITLSYAGDTNVAAASASLSQTIQAATTNVVLTASTALATYAVPLTLTATLTTNGAAATGTVAFAEDGASLGSATISAQGIAILSLATLPPGTHTIIASYAGDGRATAATSTPVTVMVKQTTSLAIASSSNPVLTASSITLTATLTNSRAAAASGLITFNDGATQLGTAQLNADGQASLVLPSLSSGTHTVTATYGGDGDDFASTSSPLSQVVNLRSTTTTLTASQTDSANPQQVTLIAVVHGDGPSAATGTVAFSSGNLPIGSATMDANGVATLTILLETSSSTENVVASYGGDAIFQSSTSASTQATAGPATQFTLAIDPASVTVITKQHTAITLSLASIKGFNDSIQLGCLGLPFAATCTFSSPQVKLAADGTANVTLTIDTGDPLGIGAQASTQHPARGTSPLLCFLPAALIAGLSLRRRKLYKALLLALCCLGLSLTFSGCAGLQGNGTPPGSYTFKVTASGQGSGATQSQVVTLTVTQ
jgi:sugar lactone lactonase YvrE